MLIKKFYPAIAWFVLSVVLLCLPGSAFPKNNWFTLLHADKWVHIFMFGTLCFLFCNPLRTSTLKPNDIKRNYIFILLGGIAYGTIMEFVQKYWIPNRSFELYDIVADSCGCLLGVGVCWWMMGKDRK